ncbi:MAG TPA: S8 family serine peptidase, partial [Chitinophagales bacterium]|nr:S8 family serine peptidase [Chitinophagales bacterium]
MVCQSNENAIFEYTICPPQDGNSRPDYVAGKLFLKISPKYAHGDFKYDAKQPKAHRGIVYFKDLIDEYGIYLIEKPFKTKAMQRHYQVHFSQIQKTDQLLEALRKLPFTEYAEKVAARYTYYTPNDPDLPKQYNLKNIEAENAWDVTKGSDKITIAIVDDAVKITHNDLKDNIWVNSNEIPNDNLDNDSNGFVDDVNGWDPADNDNDPNPPNTANDNEFSHGTHCAGISSATTDNALGIASIGFKTKIIAVKCTKDGPYTGSIDAGYQGVDYAMAAGARIISMSWGGGAPSATE